MIRMQNAYYDMMRQEQERKAKAERANFITSLCVIGAVVLVLGTLLYFSLREPPMYLEAADGTLSVNPVYLEHVRQEQLQAELADYYQSEYYSEEEY